MNVLRACIRWYRLVLPVPGLTLGFLVFFGLSEALSMVVFHWSIPPGEIFAPENPLGGGVCVLAAMVYAGFRVFYFHPLWQPRYRRWLLSTPWTVIVAPATTVSTGSSSTSSDTTVAPSAVTRCRRAPTPSPTSRHCTTDGNSRSTRPKSAISAHAREDHPASFCAAAGGRCSATT